MPSRAWMLFESLCFAIGAVVLTLLVCATTLAAIGVPGIRVCLGGACFGNPPPPASNVDRSDDAESDADRMKHPLTQGEG